MSERSALLQEKWNKKLKIEAYAQQLYTQTIAEVPLLDGEGLAEAKHREMSYLNMLWFMQTLLERKDRMSMGASLEVRVPFADHRLVEYAWNIPWEMKNLDGIEKDYFENQCHIYCRMKCYIVKNPYQKHIILSIQQECKNG